MEEKGYVTPLFWENKKWEKLNYEGINKEWKKLKLTNEILKNVDESNDKNEDKKEKEKQRIINNFTQIINNYKFPKELDKIKNTLFQQIDEEALKINWQDIFWHLYEEFLKTIADAWNLWEFYTPRHIVEFMVEILHKLWLSADKTICDPACGSGWFLVKVFEKVYKNARKDENIYWWEINQDSYIFALMNMFVHWDWKANIENVDSLEKNHYENFFDSFDYVIANPPYWMKVKEKKNIVVDYMWKYIDLCFNSSKNVINSKDIFEFIRGKVISYLEWKKKSLKEKLEKEKKQKKKQTLEKQMKEIEDKVSKIKNFSEDENFKKFKEFLEKLGLIKWRDKENYDFLKDVVTNNSELLFLQLIWTILKPGGRWFVIVPEGVNFRTTKADVYTRKWLCEHSSEFFIFSLPVGAFLPYTGVKTSIYLFKKTLNPKEAVKTIKYVEIKNDGYTLDKKRRQLGNIVEWFDYITDRSDFWRIINNGQKLIDKIVRLEELIDSLKKLNKKDKLTKREERKIDELSEEIFKLEKEINKIYSDINLIEKTSNCEVKLWTEDDSKYIYPLKSLNELVERISWISKVDTSYYNKSGEIAIISQWEKFISWYVKKSEEYNICKESPVIVFWDHTCRFKYIDFPFVIWGDGVVILKSNDELALSKYLYYVLNLLIKNTIPNKEKYERHFKYLKNVEIPLPPLSIQKQIVEKLDNMQMLKEKAESLKHILKNIWVEGEFFERGEGERVKLWDMATFEYWIWLPAQDNGDLRYIRITDITENGFLKNDDKKYVNYQDGIERYILKKWDIVIARTWATAGKSLYFNSDEKSVFAGYLIRINFNKSKKVHSKFFWYFTKSDSYEIQKNNLLRGGWQPQFNANVLKDIQFKLPPYSIQLQLAKYFHTYFIFQKLLDVLSENIESLQKNYLEWVLTGKKTSVDWILRRIEDIFEEEKAVEEVVINIYESVKNCFYNSFKSIDWKNVEEIVKEIVSTIQDTVLNKIVDNIVKQFKTEKKKELKEEIGNIKEQLKEVAKEEFENFAKNLFNLVKEYFDCNKCNFALNNIFKEENFFNNLYNQIEQLVLNIKQQKWEVFNYELYKKIKNFNKQYYFTTECETKFVVDFDEFQTSWNKFAEHLFDVVNLIVCDLDNLSKGLKFTYNDSRAKGYIEQFMLFLAWVTGKLKRDLAFDVGELNSLSLSNYYMPRKTLEDVYEKIREQYYFTKEQILNYYLSLLTKQFVIFWWITGIWKSKLASEFPKALYGETDYAKYFKHIAVKSKWEDDKEIKWFYDYLEDDYREGEFISIAKKALIDRANPYFVLLDEMNLSKIEHYLSDFLSFVETIKPRGVESLEEISIYDEFYIKALADFINAMERYFMDEFLLSKDFVLDEILKKKNQEEFDEILNMLYEKIKKRFNVMKELFYFVRTKQALKILYDLLLTNKIFGIQSFIFRGNELIVKESSVKTQLVQEYEKEFEDYKKLLYVVGKYLGEEDRLIEILKWQMDIDKDSLQKFLEVNFSIFEGLMLWLFKDENLFKKEEKIEEFVIDVARKLWVDERRLLNSLKIKEKDWEERFSLFSGYTEFPNEKKEYLIYNPIKEVEEEKLLKVYLQFFKLNFIGQDYKIWYLDFSEENDNIMDESKEGNDKDKNKKDNKIIKERNIIDELKNLGFGEIIKVNKLDSEKDKLIIKFEKSKLNYLSEFIYLSEYKFHFNEKSKKSKSEQLEEFRKKLINKLKEWYCLRLVSVDWQISWKNIFTLTVWELENAKFELWIRIPDNLYITWTMNIDEAWEMISPKVIDRANIIEWNDVYIGDERATDIFEALPFLRCVEEEDRNIDDINLELNDYPFNFEIIEKIYPDEIKKLFCLENWRVRIFEVLTPNSFNRIQEFSLLLAKIYHITKKANIHFGYRTINEILVYLINFERRLNFWVPVQDRYNNFYKLADLQLYQKILPKFRGSGEKVKNVVVEILYLLLKDEFKQRVRFNGIQNIISNLESQVISKLKDYLKDKYKIELASDIDNKEELLKEIKRMRFLMNYSKKYLQKELEKKIREITMEIISNKIDKSNSNGIVDFSKLQNSLNDLINSSRIEDLTNYSKTFKKLLYMLERYEETGTIDYWS